MGVAVDNVYPIKRYRRENTYDILSIIGIKDKLIKAFPTCEDIISRATNDLIIPTSRKNNVITCLTKDLLPKGKKP